jgi:NADH-quinone oxidoreductase subunit N
MLIALPEILTLALALLVLIVDLCFEKRVWVSMSVSLLGLGAILIVLLNMADTPDQSAFYGHYQFDQVALLLKASTILLTMIAIVYAYSYLSHSAAFSETEDMFRGEYFTLIILALLGMMVLISSGSMITAYLGLEMSSLTLYGLVAWNKRHFISSEASVKYFVLGSIASGLLLYGMSLVYGATGTLLLNDITFDIQQSGNLLLFGLVFMLVGISFKLGVIPFHMWLPDVYHGAPIVVTTFLSSVAKVAMFGLLFRLWAESIEESHQQTDMMLKIIALGSIVLGNVVAIAQKNIRRLLAYSSIAHMGFVVLGVLVASEEGYSSALFYVIIYALMSLGVFALLSFFLFKNREINELEELKGLGYRYPWQGFLLLVLMFSLASIPPTAGFYAKLLVLQSVIGADLIIEAVIALIFSVIGSFYYLRVVRYMYFDKTSNNEDLTFVLSQKGWNSTDRIIMLILSGNILLLILLGIYPTPLIEWSVAAMLY